MLSHCPSSLYWLIKWLLCKSFAEAHTSQAPAHRTHDHIQKGYQALLSTPTLRSQNHWLLIRPIQKYELKTNLQYFKGAVGAQVMGPGTHLESFFNKSPRWSLRPGRRTAVILRLFVNTSGGSSPQLWYCCLSELPFECSVFSFNNTVRYQPQTDRNQGSESWEYKLTEFRFDQIRNWTKFDLQGVNFANKEVKTWLG